MSNPITIGRRAHGFSLLEMSIVLVIIGVIAGGIMLGRSMLTTARLQTVITDEDNYVTAIGNFKQQFQALPGDMPTATTNWGTDSSSCPSGGGATGTCNGNGDGMIASAGTEYEAFRAWQQLYLAGMMNQRLSGVASTGGLFSSTLGVNVPKGSIDGSGFIVGWYGTASASDIYLFPGFYGNVIVFGSVYQTLGTSGPVLKPDEAKGIDDKIDNGVPATGKVRAMISTSSVTPNCTTTAVSSTAAYNVSSSSKLCSLLFTTGY